MKRLLLAATFVGCLTDPARYEGGGGGGAGGAVDPSGGGGSGASGLGGEGASGGAGGSGDDHILWVETSGGDGDQSFTTIAIGGPDEIVLGGDWSGAFDIPVLGGACAISGAAVAFVQARNGAGEPQWTRCFGEDASIAVLDSDGAGTIAAIGTFRGNIDVGNGVVSSNGGSDVFVVALSSEGDISWGTTFGSDQDDVGQGLALGAPGTVFVSGAFRGPMNIGSHPLPAPSQADLFYAKIVEGNGVWAKKATTVGTAPTMRLAIRKESAGPVVAAGTFQGELDPDGPGAVDAMTAADGEPDGYAFTFDIDGAVDAVLPLLAPGPQTISDVHASSSSALLSGTFEGTIQYDPKSPATAAGADAFLLAMTFDGVAGDFTTVGGSGGQRGLADALEPGGDAPVVIGGDFAGLTDLGHETVNAANGADDGFVAYGAEGLGAPPSFAMRIGGDGLQAVRATVLFDGDILVAGDFTDTLMLHGPHPSAGARDGFVARIRP